MSWFGAGLGWVGWLVFPMFRCRRPKTVLFGVKEDHQKTKETGARSFSSVSWGQRESMGWEGGTTALQERCPILGDHDREIS